MTKQFHVAPHDDGIGAKLAKGALLEGVYSFISSFLYLNVFVQGCESLDLRRIDSAFGQDDRFIFLTRSIGGRGS